MQWITHCWTGRWHRSPIVSTELYWPSFRAKRKSSWIACFIVSRSGSRTWCASRTDDTVIRCMSHEELRSSRVHCRRLYRSVQHEVQTCQRPGSIELGLFGSNNENFTTLSGSFDRSITWQDDAINLLLLRHGDVISIK
jgi:hypothetical protein